MEREDPLDAHDTLSDEELVAMFKHVDAASPSPDFVVRTMQAVKRTELPAGRKALRDPLTSLFGWAALIASVSLSALMIVSTFPMVGAFFTSLVGRGVGIGVWLMQFRGALVALVNVVATTGVAVARAAATREGTAGLVLMAVIGVVSLSLLHRLLTGEGEDSQWQEL
jgi:hypothetical protein